MRRFHITKTLSVQERRIFEFIRSEGWILFNSKDIKESRQFKNWSNILSNLKRKEWIQQIERGKYILSPITYSGEIHSFLIGTRLVEPSAAAYASALNHYSLTEQIPNIVYVQTNKRKKSKKILNVQYKFVNIKAKKFFGLRKEWIDRNFYVITDLEKTVLDCLDLPEYAGGFTEAVKGFYLAHERMDKEKLWQYAVQLDNNTVIKRIAYLSEVLNLKDFEDFRTNAKKILSLMYTVFDPMSPRVGKRISRWRLLVNINEQEIKAIAGIQS